MKIGKVVKNLIKNFTNKENFAAWIFIMPALLGTLIFIIIPVLGSLGLSFTKWNLLGSPEFVGFSNYKTLLGSDEFFLVLTNTIVYALSTTVFGVILPLVLASILNSKIRGADFFKTAYFLPFVTPMIVIAIVWEWIFDPNQGILNYIFHLDINWLYDVQFAMPALILVSVWKLIGYNMAIFLAGLQGISNSLYEAAKIDGANALKSFFKITLPMLSPTIFFVIIITTISSFQVFDLIYLMTEGGPQNSTNVLVYWLYKSAFEFFEVGKASAIAYILFIIIFVLTIIQWQTRKKWVINE